MAVKPLKERVDTLLEARATLAANSNCAEALASIDAQLAKAREELAHAQPLEVALRGTLLAVAAARQALQRAEAKANKLEQQIVVAVTAYEAAAADVEACRSQLTAAEAATARTAGGRVDLHHFFGADPGAAWAAFRAACEARCIPGAGGVDDNLRTRAASALAEMQAICALLPAQAPSVPAAALASTAQPSALQPQGETAGHLQPGADPLQASVAPPPPPSASAQSAAPIVDPGAVAAAAINSVVQPLRPVAPTAMGSGEAGPPVPSTPLLQPSTPSTPSLFEAVAAAAADKDAVTPPFAPPAPPSSVEVAELVPQLPEGFARALFTTSDGAQQAQPAAAASVAQQEQGAAAGAAAAEAQPLPSTQSVPPSAGSPVTGDGGVAGTSGHDLGGQPATGGDDSMGGGADSTVVNKCGSSALDTAKAIAAKAKAKLR